MFLPPERSDTFEKLEAKKAYVKTKRFRPEEAGYRGPHQIRLAKGSRPAYIKLTPYQEFCWRFLGGFVSSRFKPKQELEDDLIQAHMKIRPEEYLAYVWMSTFIVAIVGVFVGVILAALFIVLGAVDAVTGAIIAVLLAVVPPLLTYFVLMRTPASAKRKRARLIDAKITGAMSFISAMASADVPVDVIFKELSKQTVYGEVAEEAEWITRDTELLGIDILSAIRSAAGRSPSVKFQDFLQGVVTTSTSGGQLKPYFLLKAEQFEKEDKLEMRKNMETLGMLAESFVTVVVAFPLFLVVIMAIMALISKGASDFVVNLLYVVVGLMIPISQFGFIFVIWNMEQEA
ncbi:MAG: type II secretion system F family protein [Thermoplasmata archaeon]